MFFLSFFSLCLFCKFSFDFRMFDVLLLESKKSFNVRFFVMTELAFIFISIIKNDQNQTKISLWGEMFKVFLDKKIHRFYDHWFTTMIGSAFVTHSQCSYIQLISYFKVQCRKFQEIKTMTSSTMFAVVFAFLFVRLFFFRNWQDAMWLVLFLFFRVCRVCNWNDRVQYLRHTRNQKSLQL